MWKVHALPVFFGLSMPALFMLVAAFSFPFLFITLVGIPAQVKRATCIHRLEAKQEVAKLSAHLQQSISGNKPQVIMHSSAAITSADCTKPHC